MKKQFPAYTLNAFSYGLAVKKLYGVPTQIENIGLVVDTGLVKVPTTFAQLESEALAFKHKKSGNLAIAVQQGSGGDAYHMYPFFSGLGGYIFGTNSAGNLDPSNIGVANKKFLKNASLIDKWNKEGLINAAVDSSTAQNAFIKKQAAFWITGPWNSQLLSSSGLKFKVVQMPKIAYPSVPFLGVQGFMVTKYASVHGVDALAQDLVSNYISTPTAQLALALANGRFPANLAAGKKVNDPVLAAVRQGRGRRRPDAEHPPDEQRLVGSRRRVGQVDEGRRRDEGGRSPSPPPLARSPTRSANRQRDSAWASVRGAHAPFSARGSSERHDSITRCLHRSSFRGRRSFRALISAFSGTTGLVVKIVLLARA